MKISLTSIVSVMVEPEGFQEEKLKKLKSVDVECVEQSNNTFLTVPVTTDTAEKSFSTLCRLKTYLRSTMSQPRLNDIVLLHSHKERTDALDLVHIAETFVSMNNRRQEFFLESFMMCLYMTNRYSVQSDFVCTLYTHF